MMTLGVLGVGDLTEKMIRGLHRGGGATKILLSSRSRTRAQALAAELGCDIMRDNQEVVDHADAVLIGVRPAQLETLAREVTLKPNMPLISVVIGVPVGDLQRLFGTTQCSRAMLSLASEINRSTVAVYPPQSIAASLLAPLGNPVLLATEREYELASVGACMNGWFYALLHELQQWFVQKGMAPRSARELVLSSIEDCVAYSRFKASSDIGEIAASIAQPGTFTARGLEVIEQAGGHAAWKAACDDVFDRLEKSPD